MRSFMRSANIVSLRFKININKTRRNEQTNKQTNKPMLVYKIITEIIYLRRVPSDCKQFNIPKKEFLYDHLSKNISSRNIRNKEVSSRPEFFFFQDRPLREGNLTMISCLPLELLPLRCWGHKALKGQKEQAGTGCGLAAVHALRNKGRRPGLANLSWKTMWDTGRHGDKISGVSREEEVEGVWLLCCPTVNPFPAISPCKKMWKVDSIFPFLDRWTWIK